MPRSQSLYRHARSLLSGRRLSRMVKSHGINYHALASHNETISANTNRKQQPMTAESSTEHRAPLTIVTAFFVIEDQHRNRSARDYYAWMARFLPFIRWPMVVYCDAQSVDAIKRVRGNKPTVYRVTDLREFFVNRYRDAVLAQAKHTNRHFPADLFMVWHEKANFMRRVIDENPYYSEMFFWCDAGFFRPHKTPTWFRLSARIEWPSRRICQAAFADRLAFFRRSIRAPSPGELPAQLVAGFWGGPRNLTREFCDDYYRFLNQCIDRAGGGGRSIQ